MTPNDIGQILKELGTIKATVHEVQVDVSDLKRELQKESGRVGAIERRNFKEDTLREERQHVADARAETRQRWGGWFAPIVSGTVVGLIVLMASLILTGQV